MAPVDVTGGRSAPRAGRLRGLAPSLNSAAGFLVGAVARDLDADALCRQFERRGVSAALAQPVSRRVVLGLEAAMGCRETLKWLAEAEGDTLHERP